jgi:hypothetical protein
MTSFAGELAALPNLARQHSLYPSTLKTLRADVAASVRQAYLRQLADAPRVGVATIDAGDNLVHLGLIARLWPKARVVMVERYPADAAVAAFLSGMGEKHSWTAEPFELGRHVATWFRLAAHWRATLPVGIHVVRMEVVFSDPERALTELYDFLDLPRGDGGFDFGDQGIRAGALESLFRYRLSLEWPPGIADVYRPVLPAIFEGLSAG